MKELLEELAIALDDWLHIYASDMCDEKDVKESFKRIKENGGTIAYIATLRQKIRKELK
jgi:hypothetical protein